MKNESQNLKTTPLFEIQKQKAKKFAEFAGWYLPLSYTDTNEEHLAVRNSCGIFDISHMGLIYVFGEKAAKILNYYFTADVEKMEPNEIKYGFILNKDGGVIEDLMVYKKHFGLSFVLCVNASNARRVYNLFAPFISPAFNILELTPKIMFSLTGPKVEEIMQNIVMPELGLSGSYRLPERKRCIFVNNLIIARVGYTGEDGFEISGPTKENVIFQYYDLEKLWQLLCECPLVKPCGLIARDSLRLEAGLPLYGDELTEEITPIEAGLEKFIDFSKENFIGKAALMRQLKTQPLKMRIGFEMLEKGMPFSGSLIILNEKEIGFVASSVKLPDGKVIGMGYIEKTLSPETEIAIATKDKIRKARMIKLPFLKQRSK